MSITERYMEEKKKAQQEGFEEITKNNDEKRIEGPTTKEILADKDLSDLFGEYLDAEGAKNLSERIAKGDVEQLEGKDFEELAEKRQGFLKVRERSRTIVESMNSGVLSNLIASSPELQAIADNVGEAGIKDAITKHLPRIAITERKRFTELEGALTKAKEVKAEMDKGDEDIKKWCLKNGASEKMYMEMLVTGEPKEIVKRLRSQYGLWKKITMDTKRMEGQLRDRAIDKAADMQIFWEKYNNDLKGVGTILNATMMNAPLVKDALIAELKQEPGQKMESQVSFREARDMVKDVPFDEADFMNGLTEYRKIHPKENKEDSLHKFSQSYAAEKMKKPGFWARVFATLIGSGMENKMKGK